MISATNACHSNKPSVLDDLHQGTCTLQMGTGEVPWIRLPTSHQFFHDLRFFGSLNYGKTGVPQLEDFPQVVVNVNVNHQQFKHKLNHLLSGGDSASHVKSQKSPTHPVTQAKFNSYTL